MLTESIALPIVGAFIATVLSKAIEHLTETIKRPKQDHEYAISQAMLEYTAQLSGFDHIANNVFGDSHYTTFRESQIASAASRATTIACELRYKATQFSIITGDPTNFTKRDRIATGHRLASLMLELNTILDGIHQTIEHTNKTARRFGLERLVDSTEDLTAIMLELELERGVVESATPGFTQYEPNIPATKKCHLHLFMKITRLANTVSDLREILKTEARLTLAASHKDTHINNGIKFGGWLLLLVAIQWAFSTAGIINI